MNRSRPRALKLVAPLVALALAGVACGSDDNEAAPKAQTEQTNKQAGTEATTATGPDSPAAQLRSTLTGAFQEHVVLASSATGAALGGRMDEFTAAAAALDANSNALTEAISSVFGAEAGKAFDPLWKKHIGFLVDYARFVRDKNQADADEAIRLLLDYAEDFGAFINTASPKLAKDAVAELVKTHVFTLKAVIDAQAAKEWGTAYSSLRTAADHMAMMANGLATTIVAQFPKNF